MEINISLVNEWKLTFILQTATTYCATSKLEKIYSLVLEHILILLTTLPQAH